MRKRSDRLGFFKRVQVHALHVFNGGDAQRVFIGQPFADFHGHADILWQIALLNKMLHGAVTALAADDRIFAFTPLWFGDHKVL